MQGFSIKFAGWRTKSHIVAIIFCSLFVIVGLVINIVFGVKIYRESNNLTNVKQTQGVIIACENYEQFNVASSEYEEYYKYKAEYIYNGETLVAETVFSKNHFSVGSKVTIQFHVNKLYDAQIIRKNFTYYFTKCLPFIVGTVFIVIGLIVIIFHNNEILKKRNNSW